MIYILLVPVGSLQQHPSKDKENKNPQPCANITSLRGREEPAVANVSYNNALQLEKLREELTCVVSIFQILIPVFTLLTYFHRWKGSRKFLVHGFFVLLQMLMHRTNPHLCNSISSHLEHTALFPSKIFTDSLSQLIGWIKLFSFGQDYLSGVREYLIRLLLLPNLSSFVLLPNSLRSVKETSNVTT